MDALRICLSFTAVLVCGSVGIKNLFDVKLEMMFVQLCFAAINFFFLVQGIKEYMQK